MCRAGKDKTRRYCPATNDAERTRERNARRRFSYNRKTIQAKAEALRAEGVSEKDMLKKGLMGKGSYRHHVEYVHGVVDKLRATGKETHLQHARPTSNGDLVWDTDRAAIHREIIQEQLAKWADVPCNGEALFSGGLGGAGKSTVLGKFANIDTTQYATLNPDDIKEIMAEKGLIPVIDGLTPMEASPLVHDEASHITSQLGKIVTVKKMNVIYDTTMANYNGTKKKAEMLQQLGYKKIEAIFVDIEQSTSDRRADERHKRGHEAYLIGKGNGGRILPKAITAAQTPKDDSYRSANAENFLRLKEEGFFTAEPLMYDNNVDGRDPVKLDSLQTAKV